MDKAALVASDSEIEALAVEALSRAKIPVTAVDCIWVPQFEAFQLVIVTSLHEAKGPREAYARIFAALSADQAYRSIPVRDLFVIGPEDPLARELTQQLKLFEEGTIRISKISENGSTQYAAVFAPYLGKDKAIPSVRLNNEAEVRSFLEKRVGIEPYAVNQALDQLAQKGSATIFNVQLNLRRAKKLNLAA